MQISTFQQCLNIWLYTRIYSQLVYFRNNIHKEMYLPVTMHRRPTSSLTAKFALHISFSLLRFVATWEGPRGGINVYDLFPIRGCFVHRVFPSNFPHFTRLRISIEFCVPRPLSSGEIVPVFSNNTDKVFRVFCDKIVHLCVCVCRYFNIQLAIITGQ